MIFLMPISYGIVQLRVPEFSLKDEQKKAILAFYEGRDVFVSLPTGLGRAFDFLSSPLCLLVGRLACWCWQVG